MKDKIVQEIGEDDEERVVDEMGRQLEESVHLALAFAEAPNAMVARYHQTLAQPMQPIALVADSAIDFP
jgi:hypothetical protein